MESALRRLPINRGRRRDAIRTVIRWIDEHCCVTCDATLEVEDYSSDICDLENKITTLKMAAAPDKIAAYAEIKSMIDGHSCTGPDEIVEAVRGLL